MGNWLAKVTDSGKAAQNILRSVGPFIISQSDKASEAFARHKARLASVDIGREMILDEARILNDVRKQLLEKLINSDPLEQVRIKQDVEFIESNLRQLRIGERALNYLPESPEHEPANDVPPQMSAHWIDKFNELARARNEEWREDLLAKALSAEASMPGSISPRALWLIGTLEEMLFNAFASILDLCADFEGDLAIPQVDEEISNKPIPDCVLGDDLTVGRLLFLLADCGLLAGPLATREPLKGSRGLVRYFDDQHLVLCKEDALVIRGTVPSDIGSCIASLYEKKFNPLGKEIFDAWISSLDRNKYEIRKVT